MLYEVITFSSGDDIRAMMHAVNEEHVQVAAVHVHRFHALGLRLLDAERGAVGLAAAPVVCGDDEREALLDGLAGVPLPRGKWERRALLDEISRSKQSLDGASYNFV